MKTYRLLFYLSILLIFSACNRKAKSNLEKPDETLGFQQMLDRFENRVINPDWFFSKAQVQVDLEQFNTTVSARILLERDQRALVSVKKFGAELFRAYATPDSVILVDRFRKQYFFASGDEIKNMNLPFTFESLQSLLLGAPYYPTITNYEMSETGASFESFSDPFDLQYVFDQEFYLRNCVFEHKDKGQKIESKLNEYIDFPSNKIFSNKRDISWSNMGKMGGTAVLEFKDIELDVPRNFKISIPSSFEKMEF